MNTTTRLIAAAMLVALVGCGGETAAGPSSTSADRPTTAKAPPPPSTTVAPTTTTLDSAFLDALDLKTAISPAQEQQLLDGGHAMCTTADGLLGTLHELDPSPDADTQAKFIGAGLRTAVEQSASTNAARFGGYNTAYGVYARVFATAGRTLCPQHEAATIHAFPGM